MEDKREFLETKASQARELALTAIVSFGNGHVDHGRARGFVL